MLTVNEIVVQADHVHCWSSEVGYQDVWEKFDSFFGSVENSIFSHCTEIALSINMVDFVKSVLDTELNESISISEKTLFVLATKSSVLDLTSRFLIT